MRGDLDVLQEVSIVEVIHGPVIDWTGQVRRIPASRRKHDAERLNSPLRIEADFVVGEKVMTLTRHDHIHVSVKPQLNGPACFHCQYGGSRRDQRWLTLFPSEAAAHPSALHGDLVSTDIQGVRNYMLYF